jgi:hypothetical protein
MGCDAAWLLYEPEFRWKVSATANVVPRSLVISTLIMETIFPSDMLVLKREARRHVPDNGILHVKYFFAACFICLLLLMLFLASRFLSP